MGLIDELEWQWRRWRKFVGIEWKIVVHASTKARRYF
jgi:hypothetical protein